MYRRGKVLLWLFPAVGFGLLAVVTAITPRWLESTFGLDLDHGDGAVEWMMVVAMGTISALAWLPLAQRLRPSH